MHPEKIDICKGRGDGGFSPNSKWLWLLKSQLSGNFSGDFIGNYGEIGLFLNIVDQGYNINNCYKLV